MYEFKGIKRKTSFFILQICKKNDLENQVSYECDFGFWERNERIVPFYQKKICKKNGFASDGGAGSLFEFVDRGGNIPI
jgi:hypothetical protein